MADIEPQWCYASYNFNLAPGEKLKLVVLNADGSDKTVLFEGACPTGKTFTGSTMWNGSLATES